MCGGWSFHLSWMASDKRQGGKKKQVRLRAVDGLYAKKSSDSVPDNASANKTCVYVTYQHLRPLPGHHFINVTHQHFRPCQHTDQF